MSSIFPQNNAVVTNNIVIYGREAVYGKSPVFDFEAGEFKKVDGKVYMGEDGEILKNSIEKTLRTERYRFPIYSLNYGVSLEELTIKDIPYELLINEMKDRIAGALLQDMRISQVRNFEFSKSGSFLNVQFEVVAADGNTVNMEVSM